VIWDFDGYAFVKGAAPATVNPSLWRQALLNNQTGLFKVAEGIHQLRGFDLANITLIEGKTGWIVVDTLTARETATAAMAFARKHLGDKPVSAVIFTHSHADHFGGALGVISAEEARARKIPVVAPVGFMEEATSENVMMGVAMARRSMYMYGGRLPRDARGSVDTGTGQGGGLWARSASCRRPSSSTSLTRN
jgi:alkyl sulfatase BDS1-like metallo-beta-lactamase superfamily hydrolase